MESITNQLYFNQLNDFNNKVQINLTRSQNFNQNKHSSFKKINNNALIRKYPLSTKTNELLISAQYIPKINSMKEIIDRKPYNFQNYSTNLNTNQNNYCNKIYSLKNTIKNDYNIKSDELSYISKVKNICDINPSFTDYRYSVGKKENSNQNNFIIDNPSKIKNRTNIGVFNNYYYNNYLLDSFSNSTSSMNRNRNTNSNSNKNNIFNENSSEIISLNPKTSSFKYITNINKDQYDILNNTNINNEKVFNTKTSYYKKYNNPFSQEHSTQKIKEYKNIRNFIAHLEILVELILKRMFKFFTYKLINIINNNNKNNEDFGNILHVIRKSCFQTRNKNLKTSLQKSHSPILRKCKIDCIPEINKDNRLSNNKIYIPKKKLNNYNTQHSHSKIQANINNLTMKEEGNNNLNTIRNKINTPIRELNIKFNKNFKIQSTQYTPHNISFGENNANINTQFNHSNFNIFSNTMKSQKNIDENIYKKKINSAKKNIYIRSYKNNQVARESLNKYQQTINYEAINDISELSNQKFNNTTINNNSKNNIKTINIFSKKQNGNKIRKIVIKNKITKVYPIEKINNIESFIIKDVCTDDKRLFVYIKYVYLSDFYYKNNFDLKNIKICFGVNIFIVNKKIFVSLNKNEYKQYFSCYNIKKNIQNNCVYLFDNDFKKMKGEVDNSLLKNKSQKILMQSYKNNITYENGFKNTYYSTNNKNSNLIINKIYYNNRLFGNKYRNMNYQLKHNCILFFKMMEEFFMKNENVLIYSYKKVLISYLKNNKIKSLLYHMITKILLKKYFHKYRRNIMIRKNKKCINKNFKCKDYYPKKNILNSNHNTINRNKRPVPKYNNITFSVRNTHCATPFRNLKKKLIGFGGIESSYSKNISKNNKINNLKISTFKENVSSKYRTIDRNSRNCKLIKINVRKTKREKNVFCPNINNYLTKLKNMKLQRILNIIDNAELILTAKKALKIWKNSSR